ncbi:MAG TPA: response regulator [Planctomycetota bacterium]|nr:response regulator [Planctomycetota bacterium]
MLEGKRILVVDGDDTYISIVTQALRDAGAETTAMRTAEDALAALQEGEFDVLLTDLRLPRMNGYEFCKALKGVPRLASIPIVAMSINPFINSINIAICPNVVDFLRKPFRSEELIEVLARVLSGKPGIFRRLVKRRA